MRKTARGDEERRKEVQTVNGQTVDMGDSDAAKRTGQVAKNGEDEAKKKFERR